MNSACLACDFFFFLISHHHYYFSSFSSSYYHYDHYYYYYYKLSPLSTSLPISPDPQISLHTHGIPSLLKYTIATFLPPLPQQDTMQRKPTSFNKRRANKASLFRPATLRDSAGSAPQEGPGSNTSTTNTVSPTTPIISANGTTTTTATTTGAIINMSNGGNPTMAAAAALPPSSPSPPQLSKIPRSSLARRRAAAARSGTSNPDFHEKLRLMSLELSPLVQLTTGAVHPDFPRRVVQFWLLTDAQLESLAAFYHQRDVCDLTAQYPCPVRWDSALPLEDKRRRMGRFIGLRGCETPVSLRSEDDIAGDARWARFLEDDERRRRKWFDLAFER